MMAERIINVNDTEQIINYRDLGYEYDKIFFYRKSKEI